MRECRCPEFSSLMGLSNLYFLWPNCFILTVDNLSMFELFKKQLVNDLECLEQEDQMPTCVVESLM